MAKVKPAASIYTPLEALVLRLGCTTVAKELKVTYQTIRQWRAWGITENGKARIDAYNAKSKGKKA